MNCQKTHTHVLTVRERRYAAQLWLEEIHGVAGWSYLVRGGDGLLLCNGWSAGTKEEALAETRAHLRNSLMGI